MNDTARNLFNLTRPLPLLVSGALALSFPAAYLDEPLTSSLACNKLKMRSHCVRRRGHRSSATSRGLIVVRAALGVLQLVAVSSCACTRANHSRVPNAPVLSLYGALRILCCSPFHVVTLQLPGRVAEIARRSSADDCCGREHNLILWLFTIWKDAIISTVEPERQIREAKTIICPGVRWGAYSWVITPEVRHPDRAIRACLTSRTSLKQRHN